MSASKKLIQASAITAAEAIEYVGGATAEGVNSSLNIALDSLTGGLDTSPSSGDIIIIIGASGQSGGQTVGVTGYTLEVSSLQSLNSFYYTSQTMSVGWLESDGTETSATVTTTGGASNKPMCAIAHVFRNVDTSNPFDVATTTAYGGGSVVPNPPPITPATNGSWVLVVGAGTKNNTGGLSFSSAELTGFLDVTRLGGMDLCVGAGYIDDWVAGEVDPTAFTLTGTSHHWAVWAAITMALRQG